jgi:branched-chain amino acid transport system substrate-binding protein
MLAFCLSTSLQQEESLMASAVDTFKISRRRALASVACSSLAAPWGAWAADDAQAPVRLCQSIDLTGPLGDLGQAMHQGAQAYFAAVNAQGGVHGRKIVLETLDDGYDAKRALANVTTFLANKETFAVFNCLGTPMVEAVLPQVIESGVPFFAPLTGAKLARPKGVRNILNVRASYADEAEQMVQHLTTIGIKRIGVAYQNNSFGKEVLDSVRAALEKQQLKPVDTAAVDSSGADAGTASSKLAQATPETVIVALAGKSALDFIKAFRSQRRGTPLYAFSVIGAAATLRAIGDDAVGVAVTQVVPSPGSPAVAVVRDFPQAWKAAGAKLEPSHLALEGYINARVFVEALKRTGRNPTREHFIETAWALKRADLGGFDVAFSEPGKGASRFVELTMLGRGGRFVS